MPFQHVRLFLWFAAFVVSPLSAQVTETPRTVAPGTLRFEIDGLRLSFDRADAAGNKHTAVVVAETMVSAGLTDSVDLQAGFQLFHRRTIEFRGSRDTRNGLGDLFFRTKWTFWRDDASKAALAVVPYVKIPANTDSVGNDSVEGGFILPWEMSLDGVLLTGAMLQWDVIRNDDDNGYDARWTASGFVQRNITSRLGFYAESTLTASSTGFSDWTGTIGVGALFFVTSTIQLDYELQRGLNRRASDWTHVLRVNWNW